MSCSLCQTTGSETPAPGSPPARMAPADLSGAAPAANEAGGNGDDEKRTGKLQRKFCEVLPPKHASPPEFLSTNFDLC